MRPALPALFSTLLGAALLASPARAQDISALAAQGPGLHLLKDTDAERMTAAWKGSPVRPANIQDAYFFPASAIKQLLATPGAARIRFHFGINDKGGVTVLPQVLDANGIPLAWGVDPVTGQPATAATAQAYAQAWRDARFKPVQAPHTLTYPASAYAWLMSLPGAEQLRVALALNANGDMTLVGNAVDLLGTVVTQSMSDANSIDAGSPCPPLC